MSAFMISTETMQRLVDAIDKQARGAPWHGMSTTDSRALDAIGTLLFQMNVAALQARYPGTEWTAPRFRYRPLGASHPDLALHDRYEHFQAIECLVYQCSEGEVPATPLFQELAKLRDGIAVDIAMTVAARAGVPWNWPERTAA